MPLKNYMDVSVVRAALQEFNPVFHAQIILQQAPGQRTAIIGILPHDICGDGRHRMWTGGMLFLPVLQHMTPLPSPLNGNGLSGLATEELGRVGGERRTDPRGIWLPE